MLNKLELTPNTITENGAATFSTTNSECLNFFATVGATRALNGDQIFTLFTRAYAENPELAMKCLFYGRNVRGGLGERRMFKEVLNRALFSNTFRKSFIKNLEQIPNFGRWDDLIALHMVPEVITIVKRQFEQDLKNLSAKNFSDISLLAKWLPSTNASSEATKSLGHIWAQILCHGSTYRAKETRYRKQLSALRRQIAIIENNLREKKYDFDYSKQPSKAMFKYRKAFAKNDSSRYLNYLFDVRNGKQKMNTSTLAPYEIIRPITGSLPSITTEERNALDTTWNALEDFTNGENALVVIDGSGSMYCGSFGGVTPIDVAISLGIYFAERNTGEYHNRFITFSEKPTLVEIKGRDICEKVEFCESFNEIANTNLSAVFKLILKTAIRNHLPQEELPSTLYIISDMEFDSCMEDADVTNFEYAKASFETAGYKLPNVVFWNVQARNKQFPVTKNEQGCILVSGCSPQTFSMIKSGDINPYSFMLNVLGSDCYKCITA